MKLKYSSTLNRELNASLPPTHIIIQAMSQNLAYGTDGEIIYINQKEPESIGIFHVVLLRHVVSKWTVSFYWAITLKKTQMSKRKPENPTLRNFYSVLSHRVWQQAPVSREPCVLPFKILDVLCLEIFLYSPPVFCNPSQRTCQEAPLTSSNFHSRFIMEVFWHCAAHWPCLSATERSCRLKRLSRDSSPFSNSPFAVLASLWHVHYATAEAANRHLG